MKEHKRTQRFLIAALVAIFFAASHIAAQNVSEAELQFREALHKQQVEGDLAGAIKLYQNIASSKNGDRAVKARALLQLAGCFEALGRQSANVYQQIVRDFADQPAAAQAKAKLAALRPPAPPSTMTMRKVEFGDGVQNVVATDGQRAVYWDAKRTTLNFGDVNGKDKRIVFQPKESGQEAFVSRDLTMVFLYLPGKPGQAARYAIVKTDGTGYRDLTLVENGNKVQATAIRCLSWSWDNRYLAMCKRRRGGTQLVKISVADGEMLDMLGERTPGVREAQFSPDGRFIAYSEMGSGAWGWFGPVRVLPVQGGEPQLIAEGALVVGDWTRDGRYLMIGELQDPFVANPADKIFAVPIQNGKAIGERVSINASNIGLPQTYLNGTMIITARQFQQVHFSLGVLNSEGYLGPWKTLELNDSGEATDWSPDGRQIVYTAGLNSNAVRVRNLTTGEDKEVYRSSGFIRCL